jgi:serine/threonine protein kinase
LIKIAKNDRINFVLGTLKIKMFPFAFVFACFLLSRTTFCWKVGNLLSSGNFGSVYEACRDNSECGYVMKTMKCSDTCMNFGEKTSYFSSVVEREVNTSIKAQNFGLSPRIYDFDIHNTYATIVSEKMDISLHTIINKINTEGLSVLINIILKALETLHRNGIIHGDAHYKNVMLSVINPTLKQPWLNPKYFVRALRSGNVKMKFIDYGVSTTKEQLILNPQKEYRFFKHKGVIGRLEVLGCSPNSSMSSEMLFNMLEFYDITNVFVYLSYTGWKVLTPKVVAKQKEIIWRTGIKCSPERLYEI